MLSYFIFALVIAGLSAAYIRSRKSGEKRHWLNQTASERLLLSIVLASIFQFLFFMPDWVVALFIFGYNGGIGETALDNFLFGIVMFTANTIIYFPLFYLLLRWLSGHFGNRE